MKKLLAGCLLGMLLLGALAGVILYYAWGFVRPAATAVTGVTDGLTRLREATDLDRELKNTSAFEAPASGELTPEQVARFIRVQQQVRATLGTRAEAFTTRYRELSRKTPEGTVIVPSASQLFGGLRDLSDVYLEAWRAQVQAMNAEGFSRDEFSWVRLRVYQAAGLDAARYDARDLERVIEAMARGVKLDAPEVRLPDAPARNRELVKPHVALLTTWLGMAFFGL